MKIVIETKGGYPQQEIEMPNDTPLPHPNQMVSVNGDPSFVFRTVFSYDQSGTTVKIITSPAYDRSAADNL